MPPPKYIVRTSLSDMNECSSRSSSCIAETTPSFKCREAERKKSQYAHMRLQKGIWKYNPAILNTHTKKTSPHHDCGKQTNVLLFIVINNIRKKGLAERNRHAICYRKTYVKSFEERRISRFKAAITIYHNRL